MNLFFFFNEKVEINDFDDRNVYGKIRGTGLE